VGEEEGEEEEALSRGEALAVASEAATAAAGANGDGDVAANVLAVAELNICAYDARRGRDRMDDVMDDAGGGTPLPADEGADGSEDGEDGEEDEVVVSAPPDSLSTSSSSSISLLSPPWTERRTRLGSWEERPEVAVSSLSDTEEEEGMGGRRAGVEGEAVMEVEVEGRRAAAETDDEA
jgi:hypothetical protein